MTAIEAVAKVKDGDRIMVGGFGLRGTPIQLVKALADSGRKDLTIISNDLGAPNEGLGLLLTNGQIKSLIGSYYTWNVEVVHAYYEGKIDVTLLPQGTLAESIRAAGMGSRHIYPGPPREPISGKARKRGNLTGAIMCSSMP
jgi:3-oxoacid CoA-transferase A subunit